MPSVPAHQDFKEKVHAKAYRVTERAGVVWVYMGAAAEAPPFPELETLVVPDEEVGVSFVMRSCNFMQALEGESTPRISASSMPAMSSPTTCRRITRSAIPSRSAPPNIMSATCPGAPHAAFRDAGADRTYWRFANFLMPFWTQQPQGEFGEHVHARAWVPLDDNHTMFIYLWWHKGSASMARPRPPLRGGKAMGRPDHVYQPNTTDWLGRWRLAADEANNWLIDRDAQSSNTLYTGINNIHLQDQAVTESMGPRHRPRLRASRPVRPDDRAHPPAPDPGGPGAARQGHAAARHRQPGVFRGARSGYFISGETRPWQEIYARQLLQSVRPPPRRCARPNRRASR